MTYNPLKRNDSIILLVDDDVDDLYLCTEALNSANPTLKVLTSPSGKDAIEHLEAAHSKNSLPSLIIMDLYMPKMNGLDAMMEIKNNEKLANIPMIIITETPTPEQRECFARFNVKMVKKPTSFDELLSELEVVMQQYLN